MSTTTSGTIVDGHAITSCDAPLWSIAVKDVTTLEGLGSADHPHPLQRAADDLYHPRDPTEVEYHYCLLNVDNGKLKFEMYRLSDGTPARFEVRDSFEVTVK